MSAVARPPLLRWCIYGLLALAVTAAAVWFVDAVRWLGRNIPQVHLERDYLVAVLVAAAIAATIPLWPVPRQDRRPLLMIWLAKSVVSLGFMLAYEWNYGLDAYTYYQLAQGATPPAGIAFGLGTNNIMGLTWLFARIVPDSYHGLKVVFGLLGMIAVYLIYRATVVLRQREDARILYVLAFFPSILFWSSILGKDPVQLLGIAIYVRGVAGWIVRRTWGSFVWIGAGVLLSAFIRVWSAPILLLPLAVFPLAAAHGLFRRTLIAGALLAAFLVAMSQVAGIFRLETTQDILASAESLSRGWQGGSGLQTTVDYTNPASVIRAIPAGMFTSLFRPLPGEVMNPFGILAGMENGFLLLLLLVAIVRHHTARLREPVVLWAIAFIAFWSAIYGFAAYNLGAVARFKLQVLPVLLLTLLHLARRREGRTRGVPQASS